MSTKRIYRVRSVKRPDAGGALFAPVDQHGNESGITPSYDGEVIQRECDRLNALEPVRIPIAFRIDHVEVTAIFISRETHPTHDAGERECYARMGQHGTCSVQWARECTRPATPDEYAPLLAELQGIYETGGATLVIVPLIS